MAVENIADYNARIALPDTEDEPNPHDTMKLVSFFVTKWYLLFGMDDMPNFFSEVKFHPAYQVNAMIDEVSGLFLYHPGVTDSPYDIFESFSDALPKCPAHATFCKELENKSAEWLESALSKGGFLKRVRHNHTLLLQYQTRFPKAKLIPDIEWLLGHGFLFDDIFLAMEKLKGSDVRNDAGDEDLMELLCEDLIARKETRSPTKSKTKKGKK